MHLNSTKSNCTENVEAGVCEYTIPATNESEIDIHIYYDRDLYGVSFDSDG
jgi:hypothetical protein